jgi:hypothetical protein
MNNHDTGVHRADPTHTFLVPAEVFARYRWGRTKGYQMLKSAGFPRAIGGAYRLDTLTAWEEEQLAGPRPAADEASASPAGSPEPFQSGDGPAEASSAFTAAPATTASATPAGWTPATRRPPRTSALSKGGR